MLVHIHIHLVKAKTLNELFLYGPRYGWLLIKSSCHHILSFLAIVMRHLALEIERIGTFDDINYNYQKRITPPFSHCPCLQSFLHNGCKIT